MASDFERSSRRGFVTGIARLASAVSLTSCANTQLSRAPLRPITPPLESARDWDLSWAASLAAATDRAVFDWPILGDPADPIVLEIAERYLENCKAAYGSKKYDARVVLNIRTTAVPIGLNDAAWERYGLGAEYTVKDPVTQRPAIRNPFWHRAPDPLPGVSLPTLAEFVQRGAIVLVCDFALGNLAKRLVAKTSAQADDVHRELRGSFIPGAVAVPSGIFGLARAQNAGCAFVRM